MERSAPKHWDPDHYLKFADQRMCPALDLLARVPQQVPHGLRI